MVDQLSSPAVVSLAQAVQSILEHYDLIRLFQTDLKSALLSDLRVPTLLNQMQGRALVQFDALFYWED